MVTQAIRQYAKVSLAHMPMAWQVLRHFVRYAPRTWVVPGLNERVHDYYASHAHDFVTRTIYGQRFEGETRDIIQRYLFLYGRWEPNLTQWLRERLRPGDVFVDVGANIGYFSLLAAEIVGASGKVVAIEASPSIYKRLVDNVRRNRSDNVRPVHVAAASQVGRLRLFRAPSYNLGASSTYADVGYEDEGEVEARPLHQIVTTEEIRRARVIKVDVEGAEAAVIEGLLPALSSCRADLEIVVEVGGGPAGSPTANQSAAAIIPAFAQHGFHPYRIVNDYRPAAYLEQGVRPRPVRIKAVDDVREECDLVFSRRDAPLL